jgi:hypothetical protein
LTDELLNREYSPVMVLQILSDVVRGRSWIKDSEYNYILKKVRAALEWKLAKRGERISCGELDDPMMIRGGIMITLEKVFPCVRVARQARFNEHAIVVLAGKVT